jgi:uncharacterized membrane-anchored protein
MSSDPACFHIGQMTAVWISVMSLQSPARQGWVDADPTLVAVVIGAITLAAILYVVRRLFGRSRGVE